MDFALRAATRADYPRIVTMINAEVSEPTTVEDQVRQDELWPEGDPRLRLVAVAADGTVVGACHSAGGTLMKPGVFQAGVRVDAAYRSAEVGRALYQALETWAVEHGAKRLEAWVREKDPSNLAWALRRGFVKEYHVFESTLDLQTFDPAPYAHAVQAARDNGFRFATLADFPPGDETLRMYFELGWELGQDVPGSEGRPKPPWDLVKKYYSTDPHFEPGLIVLALDGDRWAALAELKRTEKGAVYHGFTGVQRGYRGRGLALAIKVVALRMAKEAGFPYARTNNHSGNHRMLAVNKRLGYVPEPGMFTLYKDLA